MLGELHPTKGMALETARAVLELENPNYDVLQKYNERFKILWDKWMQKRKA